MIFRKYLPFVCICVSSVFVVCNGTVFTRHYHGIKEAFEEDIPEGASTLAFVFDITGSMYDDLVQVIEGAARILSTILARREKAIHNYVLVPFHDPDVGPVTVTTDPDLFQRHLKELYVQGGGDCPEMSIGAIKLALEVSHPNSHIYVFTDARSKDYYLLDDVLKLIQRKQSQVVFVMTGDCGNHSHPGYQAYERIASTSSGQVFHLMKSDVDEVLNFVRVSLQARKVNLFAVDRHAGDLREFPFDVDGSLREFTVSVSGESPVVTVINSRGQVVDQTNGLIELLHHKNISIVNLKEPEPGRWKLRVNSEGPHTIRATGLSKIDFLHGFSRQPTDNLKETYHRPLKGAPTYLLVNATDLPESATFKNVKIIDLEGKNLQNIPLQRFPGSNLFNATRFFPPNEYFHLKVLGSDEHGYPIERMTSTAISAQLPDAPEVSTRPYMTGYYEEDTDLRCYVQSLVPFTVTWYKEGLRISEEHRFPQTSEVVLTVPEVTMVSEGFYSCNATNVAGRASSVIFLDVKEPPPSISTSGNVSGILGNTAVLPCAVDSVVDYRVKWNKLVPDQANIGFVKAARLPDEARIKMHVNDSLVIKQLSPQDEGWYRCTASNEGGTVQENIYLHAYYKPIVTVTPPVKKFSLGTSVNISCQGKGYPEPIFRWIWGPGHNNNFVTGHSKIEGKNLIIPSTVAEDEGRYDCVATNAAGSIGATAILKYIEAPLISLSSHELTVKNGEQATMRCIAEGIPDPTIKWFKGASEIQQLSYIQTSSDGTLSIFDVQETDAGEYTCVAENEAGSVNETMHLNVGSKPVLIRLPKSTSVEVLKNVTLPCIATGIPRPEISWYFENGSIITSHPKYSLTEDRSLIVIEADPSLNGNYVCQAENKFGIDIQTIALTVTGIKPPVISPLPPTINVPKGGKISVECIILDGNPKPGIVWLRNDLPIYPEYGIEVNSGNLEIIYAGESAEANYTCFASNLGGNATEETYVNILYEPEIVLSKNEFEAIEGSLITLPCNVIGDPKPAIMWLKNGLEVVSNENINLQSDGSLEFIKVVERDAGEYVCSATNIVGTSDQTLKLTVNVPPKIPQPAVPFNATQGEMISLPCNVYAKPHAQIRWYRITSKSNQTEDLSRYMMYNGSLLIKPRFEDSGTYICEAKNIAGEAKIEVYLNVFVLPSAIITASATIIASVGDKVLIECETSGQPKPEISWKKGSLKLSNSRSVSIDDGTLTIYNIDLPNEGEYICTAENLVGSASDKRFVVVNEAPRINLDYSSPAFITSIVGDSLDITCKATGHPLPQVTFQAPQDVIAQVQGNILHIPFVQQSDGGIYVCTAQNSAGIDTNSFNLTVYAPPVFESPVNKILELLSGNAAVLDCSASSEPPSEVVWYKNGHVLPLLPKLASSENGQKLLLENIGVSDAGQYICVAKNLVGEARKEFQLIISEPPSFKNIDAHDKKISVQKNQSLILDCSAEGVPPPIFIWRKDRQVFSALKPGFSFLNSKSSLKIDHLQETDAGTYSCIAMNKVGSKTQEFEVSVLVPPLIQGSKLEEKEVVLHETIDLNCVVNGHPFPEIEWYKEDTKLPLDGFEIFVSNDRETLTILKPEESDAGNYKCLAVNSVGRSEKVHQLNVLVPPQIEQQSVTETLKKKEGEDLNLHCAVRGSPIPKISWLRNGQPLPLTLYQANESMLVIKDIKRKDAGRYMCIATNKIGSFEKDFNVVVLTPPKPETSSRSSKLSSPSSKSKKEIMENFPFVLVCPFHGYPVLQFSWMKDGQTLNPVVSPHFSTTEGGKHLEVKHAKANHAGKYTCIAKNEAGESVKDFLVDILVPPLISSDPTEEMTVQENNSLVLDCSSSGNPIPSRVWLKDGSEIEPDRSMALSSDNVQLEISQVEAHHSGTYVCIATNVAGSTEKEFVVDVLFSPRMSPGIEELQSRPTAYINKPVTLECPVSGNPIPQIQWVKNGREINLEEESNIYIHSEGQKLSLLRTKNEDNGEYACIAENDVGTETYKFDLEVLSPPTIDKKHLKSNYFVKEGDSVKINCSIKGYPKPIITWIKDSDVIPVHSSPHIIFSDDLQQLELMYAAIRDAGKYTCIAGNEVGTAEQDFKIDVQVPPRLENAEETPKNVSGILNKPFTISCPVSGMPPPLVKWFKDGKFIKATSDPNIMLSLNSRHLKIFRMQISDAGTYVCRAENDVGRVEKEFNLDVQVPPSMLETNSVIDYYSEDEDEVKNDLKAIENSTSQIECYVEGNPKPIILWIKDGHLINTSENTHYEVYEDGQVLQISHVTPVDAGHYTCVASNVAGTKEKSFVLDVHVSPKLKGINFESHQVLPNRPVVIECPVDSNPPPFITWYKNGKVINFSNHGLIKQLEQGRVLQFLKTTAEDDGEYMCVAENSVGKTEKNFKVDVFVPPSIQDSRSKQEILKNQQTSLECNVKGNPEPEVTWLKDGQILSPQAIKNMSISLERNESVLQIFRANKLHSGQYKCVASNAAGSTEKSFDLYVKVSPKIINTSEPNKTVFENQATSMYCFVEAEPEAVITWVKDGLVLNDMIDPFLHILDNGQRLQILRTRNYDDGHYSCEASNSVGSDRRSFVLNVLVPPKIKNIVQEESAVLVTEGQNATMKCLAEGNPLPTISWWKGDQPVNSDNVLILNNGQVLEITNVDAEDSGHYKCRATSPLGFQEKQFDLNVLIPPKIYDRPQEHTAQLNQPTKIHCITGGNPKPTITWMKNGQFVDPFLEPNIQFVDDKSILLIRWVRTEDSGKYTCIASNTAGQDEHNFNVHVHVPATIIRLNLENDVVGNLNQSTTLNCPASGVPLPFIAWFKDNIAIDRSDSKYQILEDGKVLKIISTDESDSGKFKCISSNDAGTDEAEFLVDVMIPPKLKPLTNEELHKKSKEGDSILLECPIEYSVYPLTISWKKNGKVIDPNTLPSHMEFSQDKMQVKIMKSQALDSGVYSCIASNSAGDTEHEIDLLIKAPAKIIHPSENLTSTYVKEGHSITLECTVVGHPPPTIKWFKNKSLISEQYNTSSATFGKLKISNAVIEDASMYSCHTENEESVDNKMFNLTVYIPPQVNVSTHGSHIIALQDSEITLHCPAIGIPQPRVIWYKGSQMLIPGARVSFANGGEILKISHALPSDAGKYTCLAVNEAGDTEVDHFVNIHATPFISSVHIQGLETPIENQSVRITCDVQGLPFPLISWYRNGILIDNQDSKFIYSGGGKYLDILNVQRLDSGTFTCKAANFAGEVEKDFKLSVSVPPDVDEQVKSKELEIVYGKASRVDCEASGDPSPTITWLRNGLPLSDDDHIQLLNNGYTLIFLYTSEKEAGVYTCIATNNAGTTEQSFNLTILVPPNFGDSPKIENQTVVAGSSITLRCSADGYPLPDVAWFKDGNLITNDNLLQTRNDTDLELSMVDISHQGTYTCEASNVAGKEIKTFNLNVNVPPKLEGEARTFFTTSIINLPVKLTCNVSGVPAPTIMWFKNGVLLSNSPTSHFQSLNHGKNLLISSSVLKDTGNYMCVATNLAGNTARNFVLNVLDPPLIQRSPSLIKSEMGSEAVFSCMADGNPPPEISWIRENSSLLMTNTPSIMLEKTSLHLSNVKLQDSGIYTCIATNEAGVDTREFELQVTAQPQVKDAEIFQKVLSGDSVRLPCDASGHPAPLVIWHKDSVLIQNSKDIRLLPDGSLHIPVTNASHSGIYKCFVENEVGSQEAIRHVFVLSSPRFTENIPDTYEVIQAQPIILQCSAEGAPTPSIAWEHNGALIDLYNPRYKVFPSGDLHISLTQSSDIGTYTCIAKNEAGSAVKNIDLIVLVPPTAKINGPSDVVAIRGRNLALSCSAKGFPPPHINWQRNGVAISGVSNSDGSGKFYIENIQPEDSGTYVCVASNSVGRDHQGVVVEVHIPPVITTLPKSQDISVGDTLSLLCEASGHPFPSITWLLNNTQVTGNVHSAFGRSKLHVESAGKQDEGTYICLAQNAAGEKKAATAVRIRTPPIIIDSSGIKNVKIKDTVVLDCLVTGDPLPNIIWIKNGHQLELNHRIQKKENGSLFIYESTDQDSGQYKCVASNDFGLAEQVAQLIIRSKPNFVIKPLNTKSLEGSNVQLDCKVYGEPKPTVTWSKDSVPLLKNERVLIFPNNTLKIIAVQVSDEGVYSCTSNNSLGSDSAEAEVIVQVNGKWSEWLAWGECSFTCGNGQQTRQRFCDNPPPRNHGKACIGISNEIKNCHKEPCPVNGEWGNWANWTPCSATCGLGQRMRSRSCDNPKPEFGGSNCTGSHIEEDSCLITKCPIDGHWSAWSDWQPCTVTCGVGVQVRTRECNNPEPLYGGNFCYGTDTDSQDCSAVECPVHGEWGLWSEWSLCSSSCGGGTRERHRKCDSPAPAFGGRSCTGSHLQVDYCNTDVCPVNGEWGSWSSWGPCSSSCNKGQKKRFRFCNDPPPAGGGRECSGPSQEIEFCNAYRCPIDGKWSEWSSWSPCSVSCGIGVHSRVRSCNSPEPMYDGRDCVGDSEDLEECGDDTCEATPVAAIGHLIGIINEVDFGPSKMISNITQFGMEQTVSTDIQNIPVQIADWMKFLIPLLTPIYWTTAYEIGDAINGFSLTKGFFRKETQVNFATGEILNMTHIARGIDRRGQLLIDIVISGNVPSSPVAFDVTLLPFIEDYLQTGPGAIYALSTRTYQTGNFVLPYYWNHSIYYDESLGEMPYLIEKLYASEMDSYYDQENQVLNYIISAAIGKGSGNDECLEGFRLSFNGIYCKDINECASNNPCTHICNNFPGGFSCQCLNGFVLDVDGETCNDIDECNLNLSNCSSSEECVNTVGSFKCLIICKEGYKRSDDDLYCLDINECSDELNPCDQVCVNSIGSYTCECNSGYYLTIKNKCLDINECSALNPPCTHTCRNTPGSFECTCPEGYSLHNKTSCLDTDECHLGIHNCSVDQKCKNLIGGFECISTCAPGFSISTNGSCADENECLNGVSACHSTQICINTYGSYHCSCPRGYYSSGPGKPCKDINECEDKGKCQHVCVNTIGSYRCTCPAGYRLGRNGRTCIDIDECLESNINCGLNRTCFNTRGSYECVETPCPPKYDRDPVTGFCKLECERAGTACPPNSRYSEVLAFKMVALPSGIQAYQDLVRLIAYDQDGVQVPNTIFSIIENETGVPFRIRLEEGRGVLYTQKSMEPDREYRIKVKAISFDENVIQYTTKFLVFLSVSKYPY
ncbi:hypothetical protein JTE90_013951 [Oedothorax gibbosus]|uniref:Hemicentin-1 n=1 Tax=Oedothorax gibbosus TaxID=931172 RepID=A0AAV6UD89_9ARAC|nr:hypothetical protein JTE90_013951 [Oedothorax gibbosus]